MSNLIQPSNRRNFLKTSALVAAATVMPSPLLRSAEAACGGTPSTTKHFDFSQASLTLYEEKTLWGASHGQQGFCFSNGQNRLFYTETLDDDAGDLYMSYNYTDSGNLNTGNYYMILRGFGHGQNFGIEHIGSTTWIWIECAAASGYGKSICRFKWVWTPGATIHSSDIGTSTAPGSVKYTLKPGSIHNSVAIDTASDRLLLRYVSSGQGRVALYSLSDVKSLGNSAVACTDQASVAMQPNDDGTSGTFQGMTLYGDYAYYISGKGKANCQQTTAQDTWIYYQKVSTTGGASGHSLTAAGYTLPWREPEGMAIQLTDDGPRLVFGFMTSARGTCSSQHYGSFFYKSALVS